MLLDQRLEAIVECVGEAHGTFGKPYMDCRLVSEDGQSLHVFEGQLKECPGAKLVAGRHYKLTFRPFVNNRWLELKLVGITAVDGLPPSP